MYERHDALHQRLRTEAGLHPDGGIQIVWSCNTGTATILRRASRDGTGSKGCLFQTAWSCHAFSSFGPCRTEFNGCVGGKPLVLEDTHKYGGLQLTGSNNPTVAQGMLGKL